MYRISLINPPFSDVRIPPLALMQLKAVTEQALPGLVSIRVLNLNNDVAKCLGIDLYNHVANRLDANMYGMGDWFFRLAAFPDVPDNEAQYLARCFQETGAWLQPYRERFRRLRGEAPAIVQRLVDQNALADDNFVGFSSQFCQNVACFAFAKEIKRRNASVVTAMGGANCEFPMGATLVKNVSEIDFAFSGPALKSFPKLVQALIDGQPADCHRINGVISRQSGHCAAVSGIAEAGSAGTIGDDTPIDRDIEIDYGPFLDDLESTFGKGRLKPSLLVETSRGCWWGQRAHCTFCGLNKLSMNYTAVSADLAIRQFERIFKYADRCSRIASVDNIMPRNYVKDVFERLATPKGMEIFYEVKADLTRSELLTLSKANVKELQPGIEALATSTLKLMKKGTAAPANVVFLKNCKEFGIVPYWNLLVGFPGETEDVFQKYLKDIPRLVHLMPPGGVVPVRFDRYSPYFNAAAEYGLKLRANDWYGYVYPFDVAELDNLAYYFTNHDFDAAYLHALARHMRPMREKIDAWQARWKGEDSPELAIQDDGASVIILDSRSSTVSRERISEEQRALLKYLDAPRRRSDVGQTFGVDAEGLLDWCAHRELLFEEGDRVVSLAIDATHDADRQSTHIEAARDGGSSAQHLSSPS